MDIISQLFFRLLQLWQRYLNWAVFVILLCFCAFFGDNSLYDLLQLKQENDDLREEILAYELAYRRDDQKLKSLENSQQALERVARIDLLMKKDNEDIYLITTDTEE